MLRFVFVLVIASTSFSAFSEIPFVNWENHPIRALDISPDKKLLAVTHTAENRMYLFNIELGYPVLLGNVQVGLDPVSVKFQNNNRAWVANHISDTVSIVDIDQLIVTNTLQTRDEPSDINFAGDKAFVSCSQDNDVMIFDTQNLQTEPQIIELFAEEPRSISVNQEGTKVYVALYESGNKTSILAGGIDETDSTLSFPNNPVNRSASPYAGQNPPPNSGTEFNPSLNRDLPEAPAVSLIIKQNEDGLWKDDNNQDWTHMVSGDQAALSGRIPGWKLLDRDIAIIDTKTNEVSYVGGLMNIGMSTAINSAKNFISLVGTDATNEIRFEPLLNGKFLRVNMGKVNLDSLETTVIDLNSHLDYKSHTSEKSLREKSVGDPRSMVWSSDGEIGYVSGMGSNNVIVVDSEGTRITEIEVGEGATGLSLDEINKRLYVWNHFEASLSMVDTDTRKEVYKHQLFNPLPKEIVEGRKFLYGTHETSGNGHVSCASCHIDARMDRLAWDLGDPAGEMKEFNQNCQTEITSVTLFECSDFHPMKGPMVTQTLQDIIGHEPFHWRGDRNGIEEFNGAFTGLLGADAKLTVDEMQKFEDMLSTITFPPNPFREKDNTLPKSIDLNQQYTSGRFSEAGKPMGIGDPQKGLENYNLGLLDNVFQCGSCHTIPTGMAVNGPLMLGALGAAVGGKIMPIGEMGENHLGIVSVDGSTQKAIKTPHLRNMHEKVGFETSRLESIAGFGFLHDGSIDSVGRFLSAPAFGVNTDEDVADLVALMMAFAGSDLENGSIPLGNQVPLSKDSHAGEGVQFTLSQATQVSEQLDEYLKIIQSKRVGLIARSPKGNYRFSNESNSFVLGTNSLTSQEMLSSASVDNPITFTVVPTELLTRLSEDRDMDGVSDYQEIAQGSNPTDPSTTITKPTAGLWFNPERSGHGMDIQLSNKNLVLVWYTYNQDGSPNWYLAVAEHKKNWKADLYQYTWDFDKRETTGTIVGELNVDFENANQAKFQWVIGDKSGSENIQRFSFSSSKTIQEYTGTYYDPADSGWGISVNTQGDTQLTVIYYYDENGQPRWALGDNSTSIKSSTDMLSYKGFCPSCEWIQTSNQKIGTVEMKISDEWYLASKFMLDADVTYLNNNKKWLANDREFIAITDRFLDPAKQ